VGPIFDVFVPDLDIDLHFENLFTTPFYWVSASNLVFMPSVIDDMQEAKYFKYVNQK